MKVNSKNQVVADKNECYLQIYNSKPGHFDHCVLKVQARAMAEFYFRHPDVYKVKVFDWESQLLYELI